MTLNLPRSGSRFARLADGPVAMITQGLSDQSGTHSTREAALAAITLLAFVPAVAFVSRLAVSAVATSLDRKTPIRVRRFRLCLSVSLRNPDRSAERHAVTLGKRTLAPHAAVEHERRFHFMAQFQIFDIKPKDERASIILRCR